MADLWTLDDLNKWTKGLMGAYRVVAPVSGPAGYEWAEVQDPEKIAWDYAKTAVSPREWLIPRHEVLFSYDLQPGTPELTEPPLEAKPTVLLLLRPCDVAGLRALDAVMRWDYLEEGYEARHAATLLVSLGCNEPASKESCFCESVGLDGHFAKESDLAIEKIEEKAAGGGGGGNGGTAGSGSAAGSGNTAGGAARYRIVAQTDRGKELVKNAPGKVETTPPEPQRIGTIPIDIERATAWMKDHFDDPLWQDISESCLGCGACAYLCPSCHCFDVVDEGDWRRGQRVRNWDSCGFSLFTMHATGHNPRPKQWNRYRQRIYHKFLYYPKKFNRLLCTGCGRCVDVCPGGMDLIEVLQTVTAQEGSKV